MKKSGDRPGPEILAIRTDAEPALIQGGLRLAGQRTYLFDIAAAKKSFYSHELTKGLFTAPQFVCSFVFWGSHDDGER